jgi:4-hydroxybenzoyl-CoA thioesterase
MSFSNIRRLTIEWGDCDPAGIVYYPRYFAMFDWSTAELLRAALGMTKRTFIRHYGIVGIPMVETRASFHVPSRFGDPITIESRVEKCGRSSFNVAHRLMREDALGAECWETRVWAGAHPDDPERIQGVAIPAEVIAKFGLPT